MTTRITYDEDSLDAVISVNLNFIVTHSMHVPVTKDTLAELVAEIVDQLAGTELAQHVEDHEIIELRAEDSGAILYQK